MRFALKALDGGPGKNKLELLRILEDAGLLISQPTPDQDYEICYRRRSMVRLEMDKLELLRILKDAGLLISQPTRDQDYKICIKALRWCAWRE